LRGGAAVNDRREIEHRKWNHEPSSHAPERQAGRR
jgi:hypothetical protein